jgi:hypothetical protein
MTVPDPWVLLPGVFVAEIEAWTVGPPQEGFAPNVNVLTQAAPGLDLVRSPRFDSPPLEGRPSIPVFATGSTLGTRGPGLDRSRFDAFVPALQCRDVAPLRLLRFFRAGGRVGSDAPGWQCGGGQG